MLNERLRRVTDLFIEGTELYLGMDSGGAPVLIWSNKLNSFEVEEAQRDGQAARGLRMAELSGDESDELRAIKATIKGWSDQKLAEQLVEMQAEDIYLQVINDLEADPEWRERLQLVRRGSALLDDRGVPADDDRRAELDKAQQAYLEALSKGQQEEQRKRLGDVAGNSRSDNESDYIDSWRQRMSVDAFVKERRMTEIWFSLRDCHGTVKARQEDGTLQFDHENCDHAKRLLENREDVRTLPEGVIQRAVDALDGITVPAREAGNSDAPASSSASSERPSAEVEDSTPSIPEGMEPVAPTT